MILIRFCFLLAVGLLAPNFTRACDEMPEDPWDHTDRNVAEPEEGGPSLSQSAPPRYSIPCPGKGETPPYPIYRSSGSFILSSLSGAPFPNQEVWVGSPFFGRRAKKREATQKKLERLLDEDVFEEAVPDAEAAPSYLDPCKKEAPPSPPLPFFYSAEPRVLHQNDSEGDSTSSKAVYEDDDLDSEDPDLLFPMD